MYEYSLSDPEDISFLDYELRGNVEAKTTRNSSKENETRWRAWTPAVVVRNSVSVVCFHSALCFSASPTYFCIPQILSNWSGSACTPCIGCGQYDVPHIFLAFPRRHWKRSCQDKENRGQLTSQQAFVWQGLYPNFFCISVLVYHAVILSRCYRRLTKTEIITKQRSFLYQW